MPVISRDHACGFHCVVCMACVESKCSWAGDSSLVVHLRDVELCEAQIKYFTPPASSDGTVKCEFTVALPTPAFSIQQVTVFSQSRTTELYDEAAEYIATIKSQYVEVEEGQKEEEVLFSGSLKLLKPVTCKSLTIKLLSLFRQDKVAIRGISIVGEVVSEEEMAASKKATEKKTENDMQGVLGLLAHMHHARAQTNHQAPPIMMPQFANFHRPPQPHQAPPPVASSLENRVEQLERRLSSVDLDAKLNSIEAKLSNIERLEARLANLERIMEERVESMERLVDLVQPKSPQAQREISPHHSTMFTSTVPPSSASSHPPQSVPEPTPQLQQSLSTRTFESPELHPTPSQSLPSQSLPPMPPFQQLFLQSLQSPQDRLSLQHFQQAQSFQQFQQAFQNLLPPGINPSRPPPLQPPQEETSTQPNASQDMQEQQESPPEILEQAEDQQLQTTSSNQLDHVSPG